MKGMLHNSRCESVSPESRRKQNQQRKYLKSTEQHPGYRNPLGRITQSHETGGDFAKAGTEII
jgi:hypothetical protein